MFIPLTNTGYLIKVLFAVGPYQKDNQDNQTTIKDC
jgi:hypothetical protein